MRVNLACNFQTRLYIDINNVPLFISDLREEFKASPANLFVSVGETAVLECNPPPGLPKPHVLWLKEGQTVSIYSMAQYYGIYYRTIQGKRSVCLSYQPGNMTKHYKRNCVKF